MPRQGDEEPTENPQPGVPGWDCCDYELRVMSSELRKVSSQGRIVFKAAGLQGNVVMTMGVPIAMICSLVTLHWCCRSWASSPWLLRCRRGSWSLMLLPVTLTLHSFSQAIFKTDNVCINLCEIPVSAAVV